MNKVKITDIAQKSGVSLTTVSRYFNHPELLSPETQNKIKEAIKDLNYSQNNLARILVTGQSNLVGVIFPHLHLSFYTELLNQLVKYGKEKGYSFIIYTSNNSKEEEMHLIQNLISYRIKSLILLSHLLSPQEIEALPVPVISIERAGGNFKQINNDNFTGGKLAADLLIRNGCEVFIHINNDFREDWPSFKRILGFEYEVRNLPMSVLSRLILQILICPLPQKQWKIWLLILPQNMPAKNWACSVPMMTLQGSLNANVSKRESRFRKQLS